MEIAAYDSVAIDHSTSSVATASARSPIALAGPASIASVTAARTSSESAVASDALSAYGVAASYSARRASYALVVVSGPDIAAAIAVPSGAGAVIVPARARTMPARDEMLIILYFVDLPVVALLRVS